MSARSLWIACLATLLIGRFSYADDPPAPTNAEGNREEAKLEAAIERTLDVIDLVLEHHIDPPTRPEMLRRIADNLHRQFASKAPQWIEFLADKCSKREESRKFFLELSTVLARAIAKANSRELFEPNGRVRPADRRGTTFDELLSGSTTTIAPGYVRVIDNEEVNVQKQF
ncbi:MAG: hypothetical protein ACKVT0_14240, partial [Planctomycetaceae bacterium]